MRFIKQAVVISVLLLAIVSADQLAAVPQMGWSTWYAFECDISAEVIKNQTDLLVSSGLTKLGFNYILIDDCWQSRARNTSDNKVYPDPIKFPDGMKDVVDYIHSKGLKAGIYSSAGTRTCAQLYPGSLGFEQIDAQTYADWGFDYLKYDNCHQTGEPNIERYTAMANAIKATGHEMHYAICNRGNANVSEWAPQIAQSWRTTNDIQIGEIKGNSFYNMQANFLRNQMSWDKAGPGGWNDPDMLLIGIVDDMNQAQLKSHVALWAFAKAPLILSGDLEIITNKTNATMLENLFNHHLLKVNQGKNGQQAQQINITNTTGTKEGDQLVYYKTVVEEENGNLYYAVMIMNWYDQNITVDATLDLSAHGIALSKFDRCNIIDMWTGIMVKTNGGPYAFDTKGMEMHDHRAYKIKCYAF